MSKACVGDIQRLEGDFGGVSFWNQLEGFNPQELLIPIRKSTKWSELSGIQ